MLAMRDDTGCEERVRGISREPSVSPGDVGPVRRLGGPGSRGELQRNAQDGRTVVRTGLLQLEDHALRKIGRVDHPGECHGREFRTVGRD